MAKGNSEVVRDTIGIDKVFGMPPDSDDAFFAFETSYTPYQRMVINKLPGVDLVIQSNMDGSCLKPMEIKLTALPDNRTCDLAENMYGTEIVVRPDTIVYLACHIAEHYSTNLTELKKLLFSTETEKISDWSEPSNVIPCLETIKSSLRKIIDDNTKNQSPFIMQPVWKTMGKKPELANHCLDIFIWSELAFAELILKSRHESRESINRQTRTIVWLFKMLYDYANEGRFNHGKIIDQLSFNTKNDKAFANNGIITRSFMTCERLIKPVLQKSEIKNIILGGGHKMLSPERRFDAILFYSPELFE